MVKRKFLFLLLLCTALFFTSMGFAASEDVALTEEEQPLNETAVVKILGNGPGYEKIVKGDLNSDGKINSLDYSLVKRLLLQTTGISSMDAKQLIAIDLNGDEKLTSLDVVPELFTSFIK
jgi:hypothetical protein